MKAPRLATLSPAEVKAWEAAFSYAMSVKHLSAIRADAYAWADARLDFLEALNSKKWVVRFYQGNWRIEHPIGEHNPIPGATYGQQWSIGAVIPEGYIGAEGKAKRLCEFLNQHGFKG
jgi:hypothetical protein